MLEKLPELFGIKKEFLKKYKKPFIGLFFIILIFLTSVSIVSAVITYKHSYGHEFGYYLMYYINYYGLRLITVSLIFLAIMLVLTVALEVIYIIYSSKN